MSASRFDRRTALKGAAAGIGAMLLGSSPVLGATRPGGALHAAVQGLAPGEVLQLARVWATGSLAGFDDTHRVFDDGSVELLLWPGDLDRLQATGMRFEVTVPDLVARDAAAAAAPDVRTPGLRPQPGERTAYRRLADYEADLRMLAATYPTLARLVELPEKTLEGRTVLAIEIAERVHEVDGRPTFYQDGIHHAREWPAGEVPMMWAFDLLESYGRDPQVTRLMGQLRFFIAPVINPDGFHHSRESLLEVSNLGTVAGGQGAYWRKNRRSTTGVTVPVAQTNPDAHGIDNNRNYAFFWGGQGSSESNLNQDSRGPVPMSEPETRNVAWALQTRQATAMITHHTAGNLVLYAWGHTWDDAPDHELLDATARAVTAHNGYRPQKSRQLYVTTGTCSDYAYALYGSIGFTFEHSGSGFHPAYAGTVPAMYARNRPALLLLAEIAADPAQHCVVTGRAVDASGTPLAGVSINVTKDFDTELWPTNPTGRPSYAETVHTAAQSGPDGTFTLHLNPSTRPHIYFDGGQETWSIRVGSTFRDVFIVRGQQHDLGDVVAG